MFLFAADISVYEAGYTYHRDSNVNILDVTDVVHRRGIYIEHSIYISFSYDFNSWFFKNYNELELQWQFSVPEEVIMNDFFYWQGDSVIQADVLDRWTAENLFNEKTSPIREPGIMRMYGPDWHGMTRYDMRLFPIKRNHVQRVMIQYLVPARPTSGKLRTWLPISQIVPDDGRTIDLRLLYFDEGLDEMPTLIGRENLEFEYFENDRVWETTLPITFGEYIEFVIPSPITSDYFITTYKSGEELYYQLAVIPPPAELPVTPRKLLVLIDFNSVNSAGLTGELLLSSLKETLERSLTPQDSISIIAGFESVVECSDKWLACTGENFDDMFGQLFGQRFLTISTSQEVLVQGSKFLYKNKGGEVLWMTNRNGFPTDQDGPKSYASDLLSLFPPITRFHCIDLENRYGLRYDSDYGYHTRNFPFLREFTRLTGGNLFFLRFHPLKTALAALFFEQISHYERVDVQTRMNTGYTFNKQDFSLFRGYYPLDFPVIQTGKIEGEFPMQVTLIGWLNDQYFSKEITIKESEVSAGDKKVETAFYGHRLHEMAHGPQNTWMVSEMIDLSIESRILTSYTAYLVPTIDKARIIWDFEDETQKGSTDVEMVTVDEDSLLKFYATPNPFNPATTLNVYVPANLTGDKLQIIILNLLGQQVKTIERDVPNAGILAINWSPASDSNSPISSGTYFAVLRIKDKVEKLKLLYLK